MRTITKRTAVVAATAAVGIGVGATAWAAGWFSTTGVNAQVGTASAQPITATITVTEPLFPGAKDVFVSTSVKNPNKYKVRITGITVGDFERSGCTDENAGISFGTPAAVTIPPNMTAADTYNLGKIANMALGAADACEGQPLMTVPVTLTGVPVA